MILQVIVDRLELQKEGLTKTFGETFEVSEDRAKEILNYKFNGKAVAVPFFYGDKELEGKVETLKAEKEELLNEIETLKAEKEELLNEVETLKAEKEELLKKIEIIENEKTESGIALKNKEDVEEEKENKNKKGGKKDE